MFQLNWVWFAYNRCGMSMNVEHYRIMLFQIFWQNKPSFDQFLFQQQSSDWSSELCWWSCVLSWPGNCNNFHPAEYRSALLHGTFRKLWQPRTNKDLFDCDISSHTCILPFPLSSDQPLHGLQFDFCLSSRQDFLASGLYQDFLDQYLPKVKCQGSDSIVSHCCNFLWHRIRLLFLGDLFCLQQVDFLLSPKWHLCEEMPLPIAESNFVMK